MHPSRLAYLAGRHEPQVAIVDRSFAPNGWTLKLACGHEKHIAPHFDCTNEKTQPCRACGEAFVRNSPIYAYEFNRE